MNNIEISLPGFLRPESTTYLYQGYVKDVELHAVYIVQSKSRWSDVGTHNYLFNEKGVFMFSYKGGHSNNVSVTKKERITKKNVNEIVNFVKQKLIS